MLVEHQSKPERFFSLRLLEYVIEVYKMQKRAWDAHHTSDARFALQPVIPVLLYTGERRWEEIEQLVDLVEAGQLFKKMIPGCEPHFLNLRDTAPERLVGEGGFFGQILWLIQQRNADSAEFRRTVADVVSTLDKMPAGERTRWVEFLSYILALVYHARSDAEQQELRDLVGHSVQAHPHQKEYSTMTRTIAEALKDEGRIEGELTALRRALLKLLRKRFKKVPRKIESRINATTNRDELDTWLDNFANAKTIGDVGIPMD